MSIPGIGGGKIGSDMMSVMGDLSSQNYGKAGQDFAKMMQDASQQSNNCDDKKHHHKRDKDQDQSNPLQELQEIAQMFGGMGMV